MEDHLCPKIKPVHKNMVELSYEDRLDIVQKEAQSLYEFCVEKKFTNNELFNCVSNLYGPPKSFMRKAVDGTARSFYILSAIVGLIAILLVQEKPCNWLIVHGKIFEINVLLPYWNWADLYNQDCMFTNHWLPEKNDTFTEEMCSYCNDTKEVDRFSNMKAVDMDAYVNDGKPILVSDTTKDWKVKNLTMDEIGYIYQHNYLLSNTMGSCFYNNTAGYNGMFYDFIQAYVDGNLTERWHANWVNCDSKGAKVIRQYYARPYFLIPMMQSVSSNILIMSLGTHPGELFTLANEEYEKGGNTNGMWVTVIAGSLNFQLTPDEQCVKKFGCREVSVEILAGQTLFYTLPDWFARYTPTEQGNTIAVACALVWDQGF